MTLLLACSAKGSPGVTTTLVALALQWPEPVVLASADPAGDDLRAGILQAAAPANRGLLDLALSLRRSDGDVATNAVCLSADERSLWLLPGVTDAAQMEVLTSHWPTVATALAGCGRDVLVDFGRASTSRLPADMTNRADLIAIVVRPTLLGVDRARPLGTRLSKDATAARGQADVGLICVGSAPYQPGDVARALEVPLFGVLPDDAVSAERLAQGEVPWRRPLLRAAHEVARSMAARVHPAIDMAGVAAS
jgi:hypothetical protein